MQEAFGSLSGVKVVYAASALAGPFAAQFMAEHGAEVIWVERAGMPDNMRFLSNRGLMVEADRRNQRNISLDIACEEGREILLKLLTDADIFIESSKGDQYTRWDLSDETLWARNPRLVIVHISGFGRTGDPDRVSRPSYDPIAQAYGCLLQLNGFPDRAPITAQPFLADYLTATFACSAALAALHRSQRTGEGDSIDVAQYETLIRMGGSPLINYLNEGTLPQREGSRHSKYAGCGAYLCGDGEYVYITFAGNGVVRRGLSLLGIALGSKGFPEKATAFLKESAAGLMLDERLNSFCGEHSAMEADAAFNTAGVPCSAVYTYPMAAADRHYREREVFVEWDNVSGERIRGVNIFPKMQRHPGRIVRGAPSIGMDNDEILRDLDFDSDEIAALYMRGIITSQ